MTKTVEIVFIDDNKVDCFIHEKVVKKSKFNCSIKSFNTGEEGLQYLRLSTNNLQVIFLDIQMPVMNGFDVLEDYTAAKPSNYQNQHIFMLSSSEDALDTEKAKTYEVVKGFIPKPLGLEGLSRVLHNLGVSNNRSETV